MKKVSVLLFIVLLAQQISFSQDSPINKYLPPAATTIISFNPLALASKIPAEDFRQSFFYKEIMKEKNSELKTFFLNPSLSGADLSVGLVMANVTDTTSSYPVPVNHVFGVIKNEQSFLQTVKKLFKDNGAVQVYGTNKMIFSKKADPVLAWNNEVFVFTFGNSLKRFSSPEVVPYSDSITTYDTVTSETDNYDQGEYEKKQKLEEEKFWKEQRNYCFDLLTPKNNNPLFSNLHFTDLMHAKGDIRIWSSHSNFGLGGRYLGIMPSPTKSILSGLQLLMGKSRTSLINFENGKITTTSRNYPEPKMANIYQQYPSGPLQTELALRLPQKEVLGLLMSSVNKDLLKELLNATGLVALTDSLKEKIPFSLSLLQAAFKDNMLLAVLKNEGHNENAKEGKLSGVDIVLALPIADKQKFEELKSSFSTLIDSLKKTEKGEKMFKDITPYIKYNDELFVFSLSEKTAADFLNNSGTGTAPEWLQPYTSYPMVMEINMKEIAGLMFKKTRVSTNTKDKEMAKKMTDVFDKLVIASGRYENGGLHGITEIRFGNKSENALKQIFDLLNLVLTNIEAVQGENIENGGHNDIKIEEAIENLEVEKLPPPPPPKPPKNIKMKKN